MAAALVWMLTWPSAWPQDHQPTHQSLITDVLRCFNFSNLIISLHVTEY